MIKQTGKMEVLTELVGRLGVFEDRRHAGAILARMLTSYCDSNAIVFGIPAGGVPVAAEIAHRLHLPLDVAIASKMLFPWTTEAGFGAIAFDGTQWINKEYRRYHGLTDAEANASRKATLHKVAKRNRQLRGSSPFPDLAERTVILVDDGIASGATMRVAIAALRNHGAKYLIVAVPTGYQQSIEPLLPQVDSLFCPNVRSGMSYAVADAYQHWSDVDDDEVISLLQQKAPGS
ncbi:phosphoribosyltransferase [Amphritea sp. HPY]|uniref:phosphoribosyltransferase n=1 Tax=Amphritea sp. HPY TaxID=3421652 RepID=UPI003D7D6372